MNKTKPCTQYFLALQHPNQNMKNKNELFLEEKNKDFKFA